MECFIRSIDHVQLAAPPDCEAAARRFFVDLLGLKELAKPEPLTSQGGCWFEAASGQQIHVGVERPSFQPAKKAHPAFAIASFDALRNRLLDAGCKVIDDTQISTVRRFFSEDPWGNRLEFIAV